MTLYLHYFKKSGEWETLNIAVVRDDDDREAAFEDAKQAVDEGQPDAYLPFPWGGLDYEMHVLEPGTRIYADGYDHADLIVHTS
jgi:hypothetical protein